MEENEIQKDLESYGYTMSGRSGGGSVDFKTSIQLIYQGNLIDKSVRIELTEKDKDDINHKINALETEIETLQIQINTKNDAKANTEKEIIALEDEYNDAKHGINLNKGEVFKWYKFVINSVILSAVSFFLAFYYVYVLQKVFNKGLREVVHDMTQSPPIPLLGLPTWKQLVAIISGQPILLLGAFIFFGFGYSIHILSEKKSRLKYVGVTGVLLITLLFDSLLAMQIHKVYNDAQSFLDLPTTKFFEDPLLLILIILGFVVFVLWSILFHSVSEEWSKRDILNVIRKKIDAKRELLQILISEIESLQKQISEKKGMISSLKLDLTKFKFKVSDIEHSILQFTKGWIGFLSAAPSPNETLKNEIQMIKDEFITKLKTSNEL